MVIRKVNRSMSQSSSASSQRSTSPLSDDAAELGEGNISEGELRRLRKIEEISMCLDGYNQFDACGGRSFEVDMWRLRELCLTRGGLINAEMRQRAWHKLLGINASAMDDPEDEGKYARREADYLDTMALEKEEMGLIRRDVGRSVYFRYTKTNASDATKDDGDGDVDETGDAEDSLTVSTCASTADDAVDPTTQTINQASTRMKSVNLSSELMVGWDGSSSGPESPLETSTPPKTAAATEKDDVQPLSTNSHGGEGAAFDSPITPKKKEKSLGWELQNLLMSLILSVIAPRRLDLYQESISSLQRSQSSESASSGDGAENRLHYYQGFHDVASVVLLQLGPDRPQLASAILRKLARHNLRDNMREDFDLLTASLEAAFFPLLKFFDEAVHDFLTHCGLNSASVLSWILTWFSHDVRDADTAARLFDVFLASHPAMPIYLSVAAITHPAHRKILFANECCPAMIHVAVGGLLAAVGGSSFDWTDRDDIAVTYQDLIDDAISFMRKIPPSTLPALAKKYKGTASDASPRFRRRRNDQDPIPKSSVLIKEPPSWSVVPTVTADWVLEQQRRQTLQRRGQHSSPKNQSGAATIKRRCSPTGRSSLLKAPSHEDGPKCKEENLKAKAAAGLAPALCDDELEMMMMSKGEMSSSSLHSGQTPVQSSARNAAGKLGNLVRGVRSRRARSETV